MPISRKFHITDSRHNLWIQFRLMSITVKITVMTSDTLSNIYTKYNARFIKIYRKIFHSWITLIDVVKYLMILLLFSDTLRVIK